MIIEATEREKGDKRRSDFYCSSAMSMDEQATRINVVYYSCV